MAHKKAAGSTRLGRDSQAQRLGVKIFGGQYAKAGNIIIRQHGCKFVPGLNVMKADDDTLHALIEGVVQFKKVMRRKFTGGLEIVRVVSVVPAPAK
jgi:large subunit ribosomal protein L27